MFPLMSMSAESFEWAPANQYPTKMNILPLKRAASLAIAAVLVFSGAQAMPAQAVARTLTWTSAGTFPLTGGSKILNMKYANDVFLAVASNGDVFNSADGLAWLKVGTLNGQNSSPTVPDHGYKTDIAFGLSGTPVAGDAGVAGTPTWVFTSKDNGTVWTSNDNGATWTVTNTNTTNNWGYLKKVAYGDGHFLLGGQGYFKTSTNGINWRDAGNSAIAGDSNGKITFGDHKFIIPITYSNKICRRSTINWVNNSDFDCTATLPGAPTDGQAGNYWTAGAYGNGIFVDGLNGGTGKDFWTSSDAGATWTRVFSATTQPVNVTYGGGVFVMDKSGGTTAFSADGLNWAETGSRPGGGSGLIAYGNGRFIGLGGTNASVISSGTLSTVAPSSPSGLVGVAGNELVELSWDASADNGGAAVTYTVTSTPGSFTCVTTSTSCQIAGLINDTGYTFTVTAANSVGSSAASVASAQVTPAAPVASISAGSNPNSRLATIPAGVTSASIPATAELPMVTLNFAAANGSASATVEPIANPAAASATPFAVTGATKIVDIQVTGLTGSVTVCLEGTSTDQLFHYTGGAWVELPQRTFANGQVCGVTTSFSPFTAAALLPPAQNNANTGPRITGRSARFAQTSGDSEFTIFGDRLSQVKSVVLEGKTLSLISKSDAEIVIKAPAHAAGYVDLVLNSDAASITFQDAFEYRAPAAVRLPVITSKTSVSIPGSAKSLTASQRLAVGRFVESSNSGTLLTCSATYSSTSDLTAAKLLAAAACAAAKKENSGISTRVAAPVFVKSRQTRQILLSLSN